MIEKKIKTFIKDHSPVMRSLLWSMILVVVMIFWPRESFSNIEKEIVVETKLVYVYKESDLPEEYILREEEEVVEEVIIPPRYNFTEDDIYLMTVLLCGDRNIDGDGEYDVDFGNSDNHEQISLVLSVVMNRVMSTSFPNTVSEVIWAKGQFSLMPRWRHKLPIVSTESYEIVKNWCESYALHDPAIMSIPETHLYFGGNGIINRSRERW